MFWYLSECWNCLHIFPTFFISFNILNSIKLYEVGSLLNSPISLHPDNFFFKPWFVSFTYCLSFRYAICCYGNKNFCKMILVLSISILDWSFFNFSFLYLLTMGPSSFESEFSSIIGKWALPHVSKCIF